MGTSDPRSTWIPRITAGALALLSLWSISGTPRGRPGPGYRDEVSNHEHRLAGVRQAVRSERIVGYVTDRGEGDGSTEAFYRTQYALAPVLVQRGVRHRLVVGDFASADPDLDRICPGCRVLRDLGGGVVLLGGAGGR